MLKIIRWRRFRFWEFLLYVVKVHFIVFQVITGNEPLLGDLTFPPLAFKQTASDVILSINDELLNKISQLAIQNTTFNELKFEKIINEVIWIAIKIQYIETFFDLFRHKVLNNNIIRLIRVINQVPLKSCKTLAPFFCNTYYFENVFKNNLPRISKIQTVNNLNSRCVRWVYLL